MVNHQICVVSPFQIPPRFKFGFHTIRCVNNLHPIHFFFQPHPAYEDGVPLALEVQDFPRKFLDQGLVLEVRKVTPSLLQKNLHLRLSCIAFP